MSPKDIIKSNLFILILAAIALFVALSLPLLYVLAPVVSYEDLQTENVVVESVEWISQYRGSSFYRITTENGDRYNITGEYEHSRVEELLSSGTRATIRYYEGRFLFNTRKFAETVHVDRECVVAYDNDEDKSILTVFPVSALFFLVTLALVCPLLSQMKRAKKIKEARERKITKKYGSLNKK